MLGNGDGTFQGEVDYPSGGDSPESVVVADMNGGGSPDVIVANLKTDRVAVLIGRGDGTLGAAMSYPGGGQDYATSVAVSDVNGDGRPDVVVANGCAEKGCANGSVGVLLNTGRW
jgi:hypothetical protein